MAEGGTGRDRVEGSNSGWSIPVTGLPVLPLASAPDGRPRPRPPRIGIGGSLVSPLSPTSPGSNPRRSSHSTGLWASALTSQSPRSCCELSDSLDLSISASPGSLCSPLARAASFSLTTQLEDAIGASLGRTSSKLSPTPTPRSVKHGDGGSSSPDFSAMLDGSSATGTQSPDSPRVVGGHDGERSSSSGAHRPGDVEGFATCPLPLTANGAAAEAARPTGSPPQRTGGNQPRLPTREGKEEVRREVAETLNSRLQELADRGSWVRLPGIEPERQPTAASRVSKPAARKTEERCEASPAEIAEVRKARRAAPVDVDEAPPWPLTSGSSLPRVSVVPGQALRYADVQDFDREDLERQLRDVGNVAQKFHQAICEKRPAHLAATQSQEHLLLAKRWHDMQVLELRRRLAFITFVEQGSLSSTGSSRRSLATTPREVHLRTARRSRARDASLGVAAAEGAATARTAPRPTRLHMIPEGAHPALAGMARRSGAEGVSAEGGRRRTARVMDHMEVHLWGWEHSDFQGGATYVVPDVPVVGFPQKPAEKVDGAPPQVGLGYGE